MRAARAVGCVVVWAVAGCTADPLVDPVPAAGPVTAESARAAVVGVAGCSARGCHGQLDATTPTVATAGTVWGRWDKHGRAFEALRTPRAADMVAHLGAGWQSPTAEPRCLACHVTPRLAGGPSPLHADGVGCEACHTAPGRDTGEWLAAHWVEGGLKGCYDGGALRRLGDAKSRAEACVGCHVGAPAADGVPVREVTHDLIAAGHPRLTFDLLTFLELMPPHWKEQDREPKPVVWQAGQVETARAALTLAATRAAGRGPWPELADRNCFACHHRLTDPGAAKPAWTSPLVSAPLAHLLGWGDAERKLLATPDRATAAADWKGLCDRLTPTGPATPVRLAEAVRKGKARDWDAAAQGYYALRAAGRDGVQMRSLAEALKLPRTPDVINSPVRYDPAVVGGLLAEAAR